MKLIDNDNLAKFLIVLSVVLISCGLFFDYREKKVLDPKKDVTPIITGDYNPYDIFITPKDPEEIENDKGKGDSGSEVVTTTPSTPTKPSTPSTPTPSIPTTPSTSSNPTPSTPTTPSTPSNQTPSTPTTPSTPSNPTPSTPTTPSTPSNPTPSTPSNPVVEDSPGDAGGLSALVLANDKFRKNLEATYGVTIKYGSEVSNYNVGGMSTSIIEDDNVILSALEDLKNSLALYPDGFFKEIKTAGYPLSFYLIKRYSTDYVTGVTDSTSRNVVISVASDYDFIDTVHHEVYHYIERYIYSLGARFTSWNSLNPPDFAYGTKNNNYVYTKTFSEDAYFVNVYAQTYDYEDRASTFEYMMANSKASCLNQGKTVWLKAKTICDQIEYFINSVKPDATEYWERFVYN